MYVCRAYLCGAQSCDSLALGRLSLYRYVVCVLWCMAMDYLVRLFVFALC